ncbi:hypothetical protein [Nostoc sp. DSM 114161]|uniref:hypothetical protein n=1 Tax=Nostoc sp. DSM 114161 TaxID=3440143 RepID=UPI004045A060
MKFPTLLTYRNIIAEITLLFRADNKVHPNISSNKTIISAPENNYYTLPNYSQNTGAMKSFDTAFVAYQMMGLN